MTIFNYCDLCRAGDNCIKAKLALEKVKQTRKTSFKAIVIREREQIRDCTQLQ